MKKVLTTDISTTAAAKIKKGTLDHIQNASTEMLRLIGEGVLGKFFDASAFNAPYVISGCVNTGSGANYIISEGVILYNAVLYRVPTATFSTAGAQVPIVTLTTSYTTSASYDPVTFSDGSTHNIHQDITGVCSAGLTGTGTFDYSALIFTIPSAPQTLTATANYTATAASTRKNRDGLVTCKGQFLCGASAAILQTITTFPSGYRPTVNYLFMLQLYQNGGSTHIHAVCTITTAGVLSIGNAGGTALSGYILFLENIPPFYNN
jgi:hypothetical protein